MIVALLALLLALGGTTYALTIPRKSVGPKQLKKNAVTKKKIKSKAVDRSKIKDDAIDSSKVEAGSLLANDLGAGQLPTGAFASNDPTDFIISASPSFGKVIGLTSGTNSGLLTTGVNARVLASASLNLYQSLGAGGSTAVCKLQLAPQGGAFADITQLGRIDIQAVTDDVEMALTGGTDVGPGTYDVQAVCASGGNQISFDNGSITATAVGR
jgi:hypothetical protein